MRYLLLIFPLLLQAQSITFLKEPPKSQVKPLEVKRSGATHKALKRLKTDRDYYKKLALKRIHIPDFWQEDIKLNTGTMIPVTLDLSILSTNIESPILVTLLENVHTDPNMKASCIGSTKHKRVIVSCNKIFDSNQTIEINATLLDADGSFGLSGHFYSGKEEYVAGVIASEMSKGALMIGQDRISTPTGDIVKSSSKNMILQGLINSSNEVSEIMKESMQTKEPKIFVKRGKHAILYIR